MDRGSFLYVKDGIRSVSPVDVALLSSINHRLFAVSAPCMVVAVPRLEILPGPRRPERPAGGHSFTFATALAGHDHFGRLGAPPAGQPGLETDCYCLFHVRPSPRPS